STSTGDATPVAQDSQSDKPARRPGDRPQRGPAPRQRGNREDHVRTEKLAADADQSDADARRNAKAADTAAVKSPVTDQSSSPAEGNAAVQNTSVAADSK